MTNLLPSTGVLLGGQQTDPIAFTVRRLLARFGAPRDFRGAPNQEEDRCHERGRWYLENGVRAYECRAAGVWELWVLTEPS